MRARQECGRLACFQLLALSALAVVSTAGDTPMDESLIAHLHYKDRHFLLEYIHFINNKNPSFFIPASIIFAIIGLIGNSCFIFFFNNKSAKVFYTRDGLFLRRMSFVDIIICGVVIPYNIFFEAKLVTNNNVCRLMEYVRHVLLYISHLLLVFYSLQLTRKDNYITFQKRFNVATVMILVTAATLSIPVLFIFQVGDILDFSNLLDKNSSEIESLLDQTNVEASVGNLGSPKANSTNSPAFFNPNFCHLNFNFDSTADDFEVVKVQHLTYVVLNSVMFFLSTVAIVASMVHYMDLDPLMGRNSFFVQILEVDNPDLAERLQQMENEKELRKMRRRQRRKASSSSCQDPSRSVDTTKDEDISCDLEKGTAGSRNMTSRAASTKIQRGNDSSTAKIYKLVPTKTIPRGVGTFSGGNHQPTTTRAFNLSAQGGHEDTCVDMTGTLQRGTASKQNLNSVGKLAALHRPLASSKSLTSMGDVSLRKYICTCQCFRDTPIKVRSLGNSNVSITVKSFKVPIMCLVVLQLLMACSASIGYVISEERSAVLSLIFVKSVIAFYILSLFNSELYIATWG